MSTGITTLSIKPHIAHNEATSTTAKSTKRSIIVYKNPNTDDIFIRKLNFTGWNVSQVEDVTKASSIINNHDFRIGLVFIDNHSSQSALEKISHVLLAGESILWVALTEHGCIKNDAICRLISRYCYDYYTLPVDIEKLLVTLGHAWGMSGIKNVQHYHDTDVEGINGMVGNSKPMQQLYRNIHKVARSDAPVLLTGESGTGKELTARAIHQLSNRAEKPFIAVNCAALPATLIQSELFGHEKGAFTGANQRRIGRFEAANCGTIFLDEISDLPLELQINLLRFLEEKVIERLGSTCEIPVNARVIAATHDTLETLVHKGSFREDLYYRLNVLQIVMPNLRERTTDIELLARDIFKRFSNENRSNSRGFSQKSLRAIAHHPWPGNVRELINRIRRAMVMSEGQLISPADLGLEEDSQSQSFTTLEESRMEATRRAIASTLQHTHNNISRASRELGVSRTTLYRMIDKFSINI